MTPEFVLDTLGDRPVAFHPTFADVAGSALAGLFLSQAMYWQKVKGVGEWFYKTREEWQAETRMSRREQERARKQLVSLGILEEERRGVPAKLYYRVNIEVLTNKLVRMRPTRWYESDQLDGTDAPNSYTESTTESTTETTTEGPPYPPTENCDFEESLQAFIGAYPIPSGGMPSRASLKGIWHSMHLRGEDLGAVVEGAKRYRAYREREEPDRPVKDPRNWLREREWERPWDSADPEEAEIRRRMLEEARERYRRMDAGELIE